MSDSPRSKETDDFLARIKLEKKTRLMSALEMVERYKDKPKSVPEEQRIELGLSSYFLGRQYRYGESVEPDHIRSFECYKFSAQLGNPRSCYTLGRMFLLGNKLLGIKKNYQLALSYVKMSDNRQCGAALREKLCNLKETIEVAHSISIQRGAKK